MIFEIWLSRDHSAKKCKEFTELTMVFLSPFYRFLLDEKSESERRRRIQFCVVAHSSFFYRIKNESIIHYKLKATSML